MIADNGERKKERKKEQQHETERKERKKTLHAQEKTLFEQKFSHIE